jgi:putative transposase
MVVCPSNRGWRFSAEFIQRAVWMYLRFTQRPSGQWKLDEMVDSNGCKRQSLWRAVDSEGEFLDLLVQFRRDKKAALRLMRKLLKKQSFAPTLAE